MIADSVKARLLDMRRFSSDAIELLDDADAQNLSGDKMRFYAVTRAVELIGEAAAKVPQEAQVKYSGIPWSLIIGTRHRLIHGYASVNAERLVLTVKQDLPPLIAAIDAALAELK